jgi:hypothetical protein
MNNVFKLIFLFFWSISMRLKLILRIIVRKIDIDRLEREFLRKFDLNKGLLYNI